MSQRAKINYGRVLHEMLERTGGNQSELARRLLVTQPTISRWINDGQEPEKSNHDRILKEARELGIVSLPVEQGGAPPRIIGVIGPGGQVHFREQEADRNGANMPPRGPTDYMVALIVEKGGGGSHATDGSLIYYDSRREKPTVDMLGKLCVVGLTDGRTIMARLLPGSRPDFYHLIGTDSSALLDQTVEWAARVAWIEPQ